MRKTDALGLLILFISLFHLPSYAQSYGQMWKEAEALQKKDLPESFVRVVDKIYHKAQEEGNFPQLLKACLVRADARIAVTPDSLPAEKEKLSRWAMQEKDPVGRAVLNSLMGSLWLMGPEPQADEAIRYFRLSLEDKELLGKTPAADYRPMTVSGKLSERYMGDDMYGLLARQAINTLSRYGDWDEKPRMMEECMALYEGLTAFYAGNREAALLTKLEELLFRKRHAGVYLRRYSLTSEQMEQALHGLIREYGDLPSCADVYVKLANAYRLDGKLVRSVATAREGIKRYPGGEWTEELHSYIESAGRPALSVRIPFVYPERDVELKLSYANLKGVTFELYRLDVFPASSLLMGDVKEADLIKSHGKKVASWQVALPATPDYKSRDTTVHYTLPRAGIYVMKQIPQGSKEGVSYALMFVSPYQGISIPVSDKQKEIVAVDKLTGRPVPGAEVVLYRLTGGKYEQQQVCKADAGGRVQVNIPASGALYYSVRTPGNDYAAISGTGGNYSFVRKDEAGWVHKSELFSDRSIYRPGQTVHVSGLVYVQKGDSVHVAAGENCTLKLYSSSQDIASREVKTDSFGTFSGEFVLPQSLLPGAYYLSVKGNTAVIRVEEYKRPTFGVAFSPYEGTYNMGDSIRVSGEAKAFSGTPVRLSAVKYRVTRSEMQWFRIGPLRETELTSGQVRTGTDGSFTVDVPLLCPETVGMPVAGGRYYLYKVYAEVTDGAGETQTGCLSLPVGRQSVGLQIRGLADKVMREKQGKIQFMALNLNGQPVETEVEYRIFSLDNDGKKGALKYEGTEKAQKSFLPEGVLALPSGRYRMEVSVTDGQGRPCASEQDFILFSARDTLPPVETVDWFYQDGDKFGGKDTVALYVGSSERGVYLMVDVYNGEKRIGSQRVTLDNEVKVFSYPYREAYGDGITVSLAFMRKGVLYSKQVGITRPEPEKQLSLKWETFRDKLQPGGREEWRLKVTGPAGNPVKANLMATLYDASLDRFSPHGWDFRLWFPRPIAWINAGMLSAYQQLLLNSYFPYVRVDEGLELLYGDFSRLYGWTPYVHAYGAGMPLLSRSEHVLYSREESNATFEVEYVSVEVEEPQSAHAPLAKQAGFDKNSGMAGVTEVLQITENDAAVEDGGEGTYVPLRENFAETAFFYPNLRTDSLGGVDISFTVPDALTEWKFMGFAHTREVDYGILAGKVKTSKQFMVQPNMPRFVRQGDHFTLSASLINLSMETVSGVARMQLTDPATDSLVYTAEVPFSVEEGETGAVSFGYDVPEDCGLLVCKVMADAGEFSDGEQHYLPVLTDKQWITEAVPMQVSGEGSVTVGTGGLFNGQSKTATERRLTVELTANPDWYAVQALPVVGNPAEEDALSWATAYYANSLASAIVEANPRIKEVFAAWMAQGGSRETLLSNLEKNQDLKSLLLKETPWVAEAVGETEQKRRIALLFDLNGMEARLRTAVRKLQELQLADGAWSWYKGMEGSRYITTQTVEMLARLEAMGVALDKETEAMYGKALAYLKKEVQAEYEAMQQRKKQGEAEGVPSEQAVKYLYACALSQRAARQADKRVNSYLLSRLENRSAEYSIYEKSLIAVIMHACGKESEAAGLVQSVKEYSVKAPGMGRYFDTRKAGYSWNSYRIPTQVAAMEAIMRVSPDAEMLADMKLWLLKQKQVQVWSTPVATADAVYAFLCMGGRALEAAGAMKATAGEIVLQTPGDALGYARKTLSGSATDVESVTISKSGEGIGWGAVYAQYLEQADKVRASEGNGLSISRTYWLEGRKVSPKTVLRPGDKLTVRLTVKADRDMDFVQVKDERAACMEPEQQASGYRWADGLGYYAASRDASSAFFIDRMRKGTYVLEYHVYIDRSGTYRAGAATVQSAYAPEFGGHTEGSVLEVGGND